MVTKFAALVASLLVFSALPLCGQAAASQWLIDTMAGKWEVRDHGRTHVMGKYEVLTPSSRIRCVELPCELTYSTATGQSKPYPFKQAAKLRLNQWIAVPAPIEPAVVPRPIQFQEIIGQAGVRGGRRKTTPTCHGELPILAPACGETIDVSDFTVRWVPRASEAGKVFTLFIGGADASERKRWNSLHSDAGEFRLKSVEDYLARLQLPDRATDVTVRLMRSETLDAVRLVRVPSVADAAVYRKKLQSLSLLPDLPRNLAILEVYLTLGMWSKAAHVARALLQDAPDSLEIRQFALVGLCASDFAEDVASLRASLKDAGITGLCEAEGPDR